MHEKKLGKKTKVRRATHRSGSVPAEAGHASSGKRPERRRLEKKKKKKKKRARLKHGTL